MFSPPASRPSNGGPATRHVLRGREWLALAVFTGNGVVAHVLSQGAAVATCVAFFDVGALVGGPVFGHTVEIAGYAGMFRVAALAAIASGVIFMFWDRASRAPGGASRGG
jgi:hypothetical protein